MDYAGTPILRASCVETEPNEVQLGDALQDVVDVATELLHPASELALETLQAVGDPLTDYLQRVIDSK